MARIGGLVASVYRCEPRAVLLEHGDCSDRLFSAPNRRLPCLRQPRYAHTCVNRVMSSRLSRLNGRGHTVQDRQVALSLNSLPSEWHMRQCTNANLTPVPCGRLCKCPRDVWIARAHAHLLTTSITAQLRSVLSVVQRLINTSMRISPILAMLP